jgi:hypothetical protein
MPKIISYSDTNFFRSKKASLVISPFANRTFSICFGSFSLDCPLILDFVSPAARADIKELVIPIPTSIIMPPTILPAKVVALGPNVEVDAVWNVHQRTSPWLLFQSWLLYVLQNRIEKPIWSESRRRL